jgi:hypothetical protein
MKVSRLNSSPTSRRGECQLTWRSLFQTLPSTKNKEVSEEVRSGVYLERLLMCSSSFLSKNTAHGWKMSRHLSMCRISSIVR